MGDFDNSSHFERAAEEVCSETFLQRIREAESSYKNLMKSINIKNGRQKHYSRGQNFSTLILFCSYLIGLFVNSSDGATTISPTTPSITTLIRVLNFLCNLGTGAIS